MTAWWRGPFAQPAGSAAIALVVFVGLGCDRAGPASPRARPGMTLTLTSTAIAPGRRIPTRYTGDGENISPPLSWSGLPDGTVELALIVDDPDAPTTVPWVHWVIYAMPASLRRLPAGIAAVPVLAEPLAPACLAGARQGRNSWSAVGYRGPAPPRGRGVHHYHFRLYALDAKLDLKPAAEKNTLLAAMAGHVLATGELVGTYER